MYLPPPCRFYPIRPSSSSPMPHQMPASNSKTVPTYAPYTEQGTHMFHILGYSSRHRGIGVVGFLLDHPRVAKVRASFELRLVNQSTGLSFLLHTEASKMFSADSGKRGFQRLIIRSVLESPTYIQDDRLTIECTITVIKELW